MSFVARRRDRGESRAMWKFVPSDNLKKSDDAEDTCANPEYVKVKEILFDPDPSVDINTVYLRIKFDMRSNVETGIAGGRIYKSDVPWGTERSSNSTTFITYSEDRPAWVVMDFVQIWACNSEGVTIIRYFRIYADIVDAGKGKPSW